MMSISAMSVTSTLNECPECGAQLSMNAYPRSSFNYEDVHPGYVFACSECRVRVDTWSYIRPVNAQKAIKKWNHLSAIWPGEKARERRKMVSRTGPITSTES